MIRKIKAIVAVVLLMAVLVGCSGTADIDSSPTGSENPPQTGGESAEQAGNEDSASEEAIEGIVSEGESVIIAIDQESEPSAGFDPTMGWGAGEHTHEPLFHSTLLKIADDITLENDLATGYTISEDKLSWTFKIRTDVKFSDGEPLTANDVAFTYETAMNTVSETDLSMLSSVEAIDEETVIFNLKKPYSPFAYLVSVIGIVPEHVYDATTYGQNPIGSGPFILKQWDKGEQIIYEANPNYYGKPSNIKRVTVVFMSEEAAYAAALSGQVDVAYTSASFTLQPIEGYKVVSYKSVDGRALTLPVQPEGSTTMNVNTGEPIASGNAVTSNRAFRQAVSYAIDRETIAEEVFYGYATPAYTTSPGMPWENEEAKIEYSPEKAKEILEADGWVLNNEGIYEKDGLLAEFTLTCMANPTRTMVAMAVTEMLAEVGIRVNNSGGMSWSDIDPTTYTTPNVMGTGQLTPAGEISRFYTNKNRVGYSNAAVDAHIDEALAASSVEESYDLWKKVYWDGETGVMTDADCPWVFVVAVDHIYFVRDGLNAVDNKLHPHGYGWVICNNVDEWTWG